MKNKKGIRAFWDIVWYLVVFLLVQMAATYAGAALWAHHQGNTDSATILQQMVNGNNGELLALTSVASSVITILLFTLCRWAPVSRHWLRSRPWAVLSWVVLLALGTILPCEWFYEQLQIALPENTEALFQSIMAQPWGYLAIGMLVPVAEELVFRGAVLRTLLQLFDHRMHWVAIIVSALLFALAHGNVAQGSHAFLLGLLLGWIYYRTDSVIPGIVLHWVNNTVAYVMFNLMPQHNDGQLIDLFQGNDRTMYLALAFSLCIFLPSLYQLAVRMKKA